MILTMDICPVYNGQGTQFLRLISKTILGDMMQRGPPLIILHIHNCSRLEEQSSQPGISLSHSQRERRQPFRILNVHISAQQYKGLGAVDSGLPLHPDVSPVSDDAEQQCFFP